VGIGGRNVSKRPWPNGAKCAINLTFDFDAESSWIGSWGMNTPNPLSRGEYGARVGIPRLLKLLDNYNLKGTFFVPGYTAEKYPELTREIHTRGHEIGHHGYLHESPEKLTLDEEKEILEKGMAILVDITGEKPLGYRSPGADFSPNTPKLLHDLGFVYDSTLMADEKPYWLRIGKLEHGLLEIPISHELADSSHFLFNFPPTYLAGMSSPSKVFEIWADEFKGYYASGGCYVLICHPQISGRYHRLKLLEKLIQYLQGHKGVWFTRCIDTAKYWMEMEGNIIG